MATKKFLPLLILMLAALACGSPGTGADPSPTGTPVPENTAASPAIATETAEPAATAFSPIATEPPLEQVDEFYILPDGPLPPSDYYEAMQLNIDAGEWTLEQGLVSVLRIYAGELDPVAVFPGFTGDVKEMNPVYQAARQFLKTGQDDGARAEIERLVAFFMPDFDRMAAYAVPEPLAAETGGLFMASFPAATLRTVSEEDSAICKELWETGFPTGSQAVCFQYKDQPLETGGTGRVFYPAAWYPSDPRMVNVKAAAEALVDSAKTFSWFGDFKSVNLVFTLEDFEDKAALGQASGTKNNPVCSIAIYPVQLVTAAAEGLDRLKQTVAHEAFHCFQSWNFDAAPDYDANRWWIEGSAEYFSNVVYPSVNDEWKQIDDFGMKSASLSIFQMAYENTVFFQYLANSIGDEALIGLFKSIPSSGNDQQPSVDAFSGYPAMETIFHDFARAFMDMEIQDTSGVKLPLRTYMIDSYKKNVVGNTKIEVSTRPFIVRRYLFTFTTDSIYSVSEAAKRGGGMESARPAWTRGNWGGVPGTVNGGCSEQSYVYLMTTTSSDGVALYANDFNITHEEDAKCDQCLVGQWTLDLPSYGEFFTRGLYEGDNASYELNTIEGSRDLYLSETGYFENVYDSLLVDATMYVPGVGDEKWAMAMQHFTTGMTLGRFWVNETSSNLIFVANQSTAVVVTALNGNAGDPKTLNDDLDVIGAGSPYKCDATTLSIMTEDPDGKLSAILFNRVVKKP